MTQLVQRYYCPQLSYCLCVCVCVKVENFCYFFVRFSVFYNVLLYVI